MILRYEPGDATAVVRRSTIVLLPRTAPRDYALRLWDRMPDEAGLVEALEAVEAVSGGGLRDLPPFAVVAIDGKRAQIAVRGDLSVSIDVAGEDGVERCAVDGNGVATWTEKVFTDVVELAVRADGARQDGPLVDDTDSWPVFSGIVAADGIAVRPDDAAPSTWTEPSTSDSTINTPASPAGSAADVGPFVLDEDDSTEAVRAAFYEAVPEAQTDTPIGLTSLEDGGRMLLNGAAHVATGEQTAERSAVAVADPPAQEQFDEAEAVLEKTAEETAEEPLAVADEAEAVLEETAEEPLAVADEAEAVLEETAEEPLAVADEAEAVLEETAEEPLAVADEAEAVVEETADSGADSPKAVVTAWGYIVKETPAESVHETEAVDQAVAGEAPDAEDESAHETVVAEQTPAEDTAEADAVDEAVAGETPAEDTAEADGITGAHAEDAAEAPVEEVALDEASGAQEAPVGLATEEMPIAAAPGEHLAEPHADDLGRSDDAFADTPASAPVGVAPQPTEPPEIPAQERTALPEGDDFDHDGETVTSATLDKYRMGEPQESAADPVVTVGEQVLARVCGMGHSNPPEFDVCAACGEPLSNDPQYVKRPSLGRLRFSTGQVIELDRGVIAGRRPRTTRGQGPDMPYLVKVNSPQQDISRSHIEVSLDGWKVQVADLATTNGTTLIRPGQPATQLRPNERVTVADGDLVDLGDGVTMAFEGLL